MEVQDITIEPVVRHDTVELQGSVPFIEVEVIDQILLRAVIRPMPTIDW